MGASITNGILWPSGQLKTKCIHQIIDGSFKFLESSKYETQKSNSLSFILSKYCVLI